MSARVDPLDKTSKITEANGTPSPFLIRQWQNLLRLVRDTAAAAAAALAAQTTANEVQSRVITAGVGLDGGGNLSGNITIDLGNTSVIPGTYGDSTHVSQLTVDAQGRLTFAGNVAISFPTGDINPFSDGGITKPTAAAFTIADDTTTNHGTGAKADLVSRGVQFTHTQSGTPISSQTLFYKAAVSSTLVSCIAYVMPNFNDRASNWFYGLACRDNTGKIHAFGLRNTGASSLFTDFRYTTVSAVSTTVNQTGGNFCMGRPVWMKLELSGGNFVFSISLDGEVYTAVETISATTFIGSTLNDVGIFVVNNMGSAGSILRLDCFSFTHS